MSPMTQALLLTAANYAPWFILLALLFVAGKVARWRRIRARRRKGITRWDCNDLVSHIIDEQYP